VPFAVATTGVKTLPDVSITHSLVQMVIALVVIVGCIWGLGKILARMRSGAASPKRRSAGKASGNSLAVVSRQSLGKDLSIATVRWGEREVLVGIAGSTITFLNEARTESPASAAPEAAPPIIADPPAGDPWAGLEDPFASYRPGNSPGIAAPAPSEGPMSFIESLRNATLRR
jgi:flagellar biogenesis protein FliO